MKLRVATDTTAKGEVFLDTAGEGVQEMASIAFSSLGAINCRREGVGNESEGCIP
jgi:hypothetical protein